MDEFRLYMALANGGIARLSPLQRIGFSILQFAADIIPDAKIEKKRRLFDSIMADHDNMISRLCFGYSRSKEEFQDLRQDTYVNIWQGLENFCGASSLKTWIYKVTLNTCVSTLRKRKKDGTSLDVEELSDIIDDSEDTMQMISDLYKAIDRLNPVDKAIVMMWLDDMSYDEMAEATGLGRNTLATRLRRAKEKIKQLI